MKWFCSEDPSPEFVDVIEADSAWEAAQEYFKFCDENEMGEQNEKTVYVFADIRQKPEVFGVVRDFEPVYYAFVPSANPAPLKEAKP